MPERRVVRNPDLLIYWGDEGLLARDLRTGVQTPIRPEVASLLDLFDRPRPPSAAEVLGTGSKAGIARTVRELVRRRLLLLETDAAPRSASVTKAWKSNLASAHYRAATRDMVYIQRLDRMRKYLVRVAATQRRPPKFKHYRSAVRVRLARVPTPRLSAAPLGEVLTRRRTNRRYSRQPVPFEDLSAVVGGTWGQTGWLPDPILGRHVLKTSPSAGSLHPIECYVLAFRVQGLARGLYHFDVASHELRRLRSGDFGRDAVRAASGQHWVRWAGFVCVLTAAFTRNLWKYQGERAYRSVWIDAGHLAQTFSLLATARGLGPFTTAAIQESVIERLIGLDGVTEFPVYICGAGVPAKDRRSEPGS